MIQRSIKCLVIGQWVLAPLPGLLMAALVALSIRGSQLLGKMPIAFQNDPNHLGMQDAIYQGFNQTVSWLLSAFLISFVIWFPWSIVTAAVGLRQWYRERQRGWAVSGGIAIAIYGLGLLLLMFEPTNRLGWYLD